MGECFIQPVDRETADSARTLVERYDFQILDAILIASAIEAGCSTLFTEDMPHGPKVAGRLTIINPFL
jgi:predicted nucleic acid-binding protein